MKCAHVPASILIASAAVIGCSPAADSADAAAAGGQASWDDVQFVEDLRIGTLDGDDDYIFGAVQHIAVLPDGSIAVADGQGPRLRLYSADGRFVRDIGAIGEGPGEYRGIVGLATTPDGRLAVWDLPNGRVNLYSASGDYLSMFRAVSGWWGGDSFRIDTAGRYWVFTSLPTAAALQQHPEGAVEGPGMRQGAYIRFSPDGETLDTVLVPQAPSTTLVPTFILLTPEGALEPFTERFVTALSPEGYFVTGTTTQYALDLHRPEGPLRIEREHAPVRLARAERADWSARADYYSRRGGASAGVNVPETKPAFRGIATGVDGRIWVDRYVEARERTDLPPQRPDAPPRITWREPRTFDVFESDGRLLGTIQVPDRTQILLRNGDLAWGVRRGELDEQYVVRLRVEPASGNE